MFIFDQMLSMPVKSKVITFKIVTVFLCSFAISSTSYATDYYVDQKNPNASDDNDGSIASPWKTLLKAVGVAAAGDTVTVKAGVYMDTTEFTAGSIPGGFSPKKSGTSGNPIIYRSDPPYTATILAQPMDQVTLGRAAAWKIQNKSYITIDGFKIRGQLRIRESDHMEVINNELVEGSATGTDTSVFWGIDIEGTSDSLIKNNYVHRLFNNGDFSHNSAAIMVNAESDNNIIEGNTADVSGSSVYAPFGTKGGKTDNNIWRYNFAVCGDLGESGFYITSSSGNLIYPIGNQVHNNVILNCKYGAEVNNHIATPQPIYNNTAYNVNAFYRAKDTSVQDQEVWNNIVVNATRGEPDKRRGLYEWGGYDTKAIAGAPPPFDVDAPVDDFELLLNYSDYNSASGSSSFYAFRIADQSFAPEVYATLFEWQNNTPFGDNSNETDPGFVNPGGSTAQDYKRKAYPANGRGAVGGTDSADVMGAYVTGNEVIGFVRVGIALPSASAISKDP